MQKIEFQTTDELFTILKNIVESDTIIQFPDHIVMLLVEFCISEDVHELENLCTFINRIN